MNSSPSSRRQSRRISYTDMPSPTSPVQSISRRSSGFSTTNRRSSNRLSGDLSGLQVNGMENLADELGEGWDSEEAIEGSISELQEEDVNGAISMSPDAISLQPRSEHSQVNGIDFSPPSRSANNGPDDPKSPSLRTFKAGGHTRTKSRQSGSWTGKNDAGAQEDPFAIPATLSAAMADIEGLVKQGLANKNNTTMEGHSAKDPDILRAIACLRDLGPQSGIESGIARLVTAHNAVSTNLANQTRHIQSTSYFLLSPSLQLMDTALIDGILSSLNSCTADLPQPTVKALASLTRLSHDTRDVITLTHDLADSLHMSRQVIDAAARWLRSSLEMARELRKEAMRYEQARDWIDRGDWQAKLARRDCAAQCKDILNGFEEVCDDYMKSMLASETSQATSVGAA